MAIWPNRREDMGPKDKSYDQLTEVIDGLDTRQVVTLICNWFDGRELEKFTAFAREEHGYEDEDEDEDHGGLNEDDLEHLKEQLEGMDEDGTAENAENVMTSIGYVELHPDGEVVYHGVVITTIERD